MNEEILTAYEPAARIYCGKLGMDPDTMVPDTDQVLIGVQKMVPLWHSAAMELHDFSLRMVSLKEAGILALKAH